MRALPTLLLSATLALIASSPASPATASLPAPGATPADVVRVFVQLLLTPNLELSKSPDAQGRFLAPSLLRDFLETRLVTEAMTAAHPTLRIDTPDNSTFLM